MPYISNKEREAILTGMKTPETAGELNFMFTMIILDYIDLNGENYQTYNDIIGAMENCKLETYRRKVSLYEDGKIKSNGDVYQ